MTAVAFSLRRREARTARRERLNARALTTIGPATAPVEERPSRSLLWFIGASLVAHPAVVALLTLLPEGEVDKAPSYESVQINIAADPVEKAAPAEKTPETPEQPQLTQRVATVTKPTLTPPKPDEPPPVDPIDLAPPTNTPNEPAKRIVGVSMESTTTGSGPSFAVGNTRMGDTGTTAADPNGVGRLSGSATPPRRTSSRPPVYPPSLRAQNIEGDVGLRVEIDPSGRVTNATVARSSGHDEFDRAAIDAARASSYEPAKAGGIAVTQSIEFTVRFRLH